MCRAYAITTLYIIAAIIAFLAYTARVDAPLGDQEECQANGALPSCAPYQVPRASAPNQSPGEQH